MLCEMVIPDEDEINADEGKAYGIVHVGDSLLPVIEKY